MARGGFPAKPGPDLARRAVHQEQAARKAEAEAEAVARPGRRQREKAVAARAQAEQNAQIAGMQATLALNTIQDLVSQVQKGIQGPGLYDLKTALLDSALKRIDGVAGIYEKSTSKEATTAAALMELGKIYRQLGQTQKAFKSTRNAWRSPRNTSRSRIIAIRRGRTWQTPTSSWPFAARN